MWTAQFTRRDAIELFLSAKLPRGIEPRSTTIAHVENSGELYQAFWSEHPGNGLRLPNLVVTPSGSQRDFLIAVNSSPSGTAPVTGLTRFLSRRDADFIFASSGWLSDENTLVPIVALAMSEVVAHGSGRLHLRDVTLQDCKRTFSYAWGKALAAGTSASILAELPTRWLEVRKIVGSPSRGESSVSALIEPLSILSRWAAGITGGTDSDQLFLALMQRDSFSVERHWTKLSRSLGLEIPLRSIISSSRETRGTYLQHALKFTRSNPNDKSAHLACAFLATQVAPQSLEHLETLRKEASLEVVFWYTLLTIAQSASDLMLIVGGIGLRVLKEIRVREEILNRPTADIAYSEFDVIARSGLSSVTRNFRSAGDLEIELVPMVACNFDLSSPAQGALPVDRTPLIKRFSVDDELSLSLKAKIKIVMKLMTEISRDLPDDGSLPTTKTGTVKARKPAGRS